MNGKHYRELWHQQIKATEQLQAELEECSKSCAIYINESAKAQAEVNKLRHAIETVSGRALKVNFLDEYRISPKDYEKLKSLVRR